MSGFSPIAELIKERLPLEEVVGEEIHLIQRGSRLFGLCPFHEEKTPSFTVNPSGQFYYCFGCRKTGDVISYVMETKGLSFKEAVELLARRAGLEDRLPHGWEDGGSAQDKDQLSCLQVAQDFYRECLRHAGTGNTARSYLKERGILEKTQEAFCLGWAPTNSQAILSRLQDKGVRFELAVSLGLLNAIGPSEYRDPMAGRVIFPIHDERGRAVAFGGRSIRSTQVPKYLNSKEHRFFKKGRILYGLHQADGAIRKSGTAYVVEGYMDVLALFQAGIPNVVATLGVALSKDHVQKLSKRTMNICFLLDGDPAGVAGLMRAFALLVEMGVWGYGILLPEGHDPDSFLRSRGQKEMEKRLLNRLPLVDLYVLERLKGVGSSFEGKARIVGEFKKMLESCPDPVYRSFLWERFKERAGFVLPGLRPKARDKHNASSGLPSGKIPIKPEPIILMLAFLIQFPAYKPHFEPLVSYLDSAEDSRILRVWSALQKLPMNQGPLWQEMRHAPEIQESGSYLISFLDALESFGYASLPDASVEGVFQELLYRVQAKAFLKKSAELNLKIRSAEMNGEIEALRAFLAEKKAILEAIKNRVFPRANS